MRNVGVGLVVAVYVALVLTSSVAPIYVSDDGIVDTRAHSNPDPTMSAVAVAGIAIAVIPLRRGERWAALATLAIFVMVLVTQFKSGAPRLIPHHPNQHDFPPWIASVLAVLAVTGLAMTSNLRLVVSPPPPTLESPTHRV